MPQRLRYSPPVTDDRKMHAPKRGYAFLVVAVLVISFWVYWAMNAEDAGLDFETLFETAKRFAAHPLAPLATIPAFIAGSFLVAPIYGMIAVAGLVFGPWTATVSALVATMVASAVTHWMGVHFGRIFSHHIPDTVTDRINSVAAHADTWAIAGLQCLPIAPFTILNMLVGVAGVPFRVFMAGTFITMVPTVVLITLSVDRARAILAGEGAFDPWIVLTLCAAGAALIVLRVWQKRGKL